MALKIIYSKLAKDDLYEIYEFIKRDSIFYAKKEIHDIRHVIGTLKRNNSIYKRFADVDDESIRELVFKNYRIIYQIIPESQINIITIHHHARSISKNPAFDPEQ